MRMLRYELRRPNKIVLHTIGSHTRQTHINSFKTLLGSHTRQAHINSFKTLLFTLFRVIIVKICVDAFEDLNISM